LRKLTEAGMPLGVVADIAGHSDVRVTHSFYGSFAADRLQAIFDRYGGALDGGSSAEGPSA
jgi:intergrase/recombinase